jgi:hypothetical protein
MEITVLKELIYPTINVFPLNLSHLVESGTRVWVNVYVLWAHFGMEAYVFNAQEDKYSSQTSVAPALMEPSLKIIDALPCL